MKEVYPIDPQMVEEFIDGISTAPGFVCDRASGVHQGCVCSYSAAVKDMIGSSPKVQALLLAMMASQALVPGSALDCLGMLLSIGCVIGQQSMLNYQKGADWVVPDELEVPAK